MAGSERIRPPWWLTYVNKAIIAVNRTGLLTAGPVGPHPDEFEALAGRCPVFRFDNV